MGPLSFNPIVVLGVLSVLHWGARWGAGWYLHRKGFAEGLFENRSVRQVWLALGRARDCGEPEIERVASWLAVVIAVTLFLSLSVVVVFALSLFGVIG